MAVVKRVDKPVQVVENFAPTCPRCSDILPPGALICDCGARTTQLSLDPRVARGYPSDRMETTP